METIAISPTLYKNIGLVLCAFLSVYAGYTLLRPLYSGTHIIEHQYAADFSDKKNLIGASTHVFVGKFLEKKGTTLLGSLPATIFSVELMDNVKGKLSGTIELIQEGGCIDGDCYVSEGDIMTQIGTGSTTSVSPLGKTYILSVRGNDKDGYTLISHPAGKWELPENTSKEDIKKSNTYKEFRKAYTEEVYLSADTENKNIKNAYVDLPKDQKEEILSEIKN